MSIVIVLACLLIELAAVCIGAHIYANAWRRNEAENAKRDWIKFELESGATLLGNRITGGLAGAVAGLIPVCVVAFAAILI